MQKAHSFQQIEDDSDGEDPPKKVKASTQANPAVSFLRRKKKSPNAATADPPSTTELRRESPRRTGSQRGIMSIEDDAVQKPKRNTLAFRRGSGRVKPKKSPKERNQSLLESSVDVLPEADDPVMALFQARNTQKVRFSLGGVEPKERGKRPTPPIPPISADGDDDNNKNNSSSSSEPVTAAETTETVVNVPEKGSSSFNIKKFMKGTLFGGSKGKGAQSDEFDLEIAEELKAAQQNNEIVWSSEEEPINTAPQTSFFNGIGKSTYEVDVTSFIEDGTVKASVTKLLNKARRAQFLHFRYSYAVKCYVRALEILKQAKYPDDHPTVVKTMSSLDKAHFANSSYINSANIVKLGIKYEDAKEFVRALKMYTIAYRIRRDNLSASHPSLVVLLNMLGNIQIKRGELQEAMSIYELALKDTNPSMPSSPMSSDGDDSVDIRPTNYLTRAITYREMGTIHEQYGEPKKALTMYHRSLDCMAEYKGLAGKPFLKAQLESENNAHDNGGLSSQLLHPTERDILNDLEKTRISGGVGSSRSTPQSSPRRSNALNTSQDVSLDDGMELTFGDSKKGKKSAELESTTSGYDIFFPASLVVDETQTKPRRLTSKKDKAAAVENDANKMKQKQGGDYTDVDVALTIHRIAQLHRMAEEYALAVPAFQVSLRGMKYALGKSHPNVAAILGNIGNLQKEMGDMDSAYTTYQQVLAIESYRLGLSHPDVVVTLHNIATIDAARGNHEHALSLYTQVVSLQRKLFGEDHESVAVTSACMGDVHERLGDFKSAVGCYEESLRIKIAALGRHSLEVARLLHKLGKLSMGQDDFHLAQSYVSKAALVYRLNKLQDDDEWVVDVRRDEGNVNAAIELGQGVDFFEC